MTWPDILALIAFAVMLGGWRLTAWCWRQERYFDDNGIPHRNNDLCDCQCCVSTTLAMVERDTERVTR